MFGHLLYHISCAKGLLFYLVLKYNSEGALQFFPYTFFSQPALFLMVFHNIHWMFIIQRI